MLRVSSEPEPIEYATVFYAQGESADESFAAFDRLGPRDFLPWLADTYGLDSTDSEWSQERPFGTGDSCYWTGQEGTAGYVITLHPGRLYIAVTAWRER